MKHHGFDLRSVIRRRELLKILAAAGAAAALPGAAGLSEQTNGRLNRLTARGGAIDVHHHHQPPGLAGGGFHTRAERCRSSPGASESLSK